MLLNGSKIYTVGHWKLKNALSHAKGHAFEREDSRRELLPFFSSSANRLRHAVIIFLIDCTSMSLSKLVLRTVNNFEISV